MRDDSFANIVSTIEEGTAVCDKLRKFLTYILSSNIHEIAPSIVRFAFR